MFIMAAVVITGVMIKHSLVALERYTVFYDSTCSDSWNSLNDPNCFITLMAVIIIIAVMIIMAVMPIKAETSWGWTGPSSDQTGTGLYFNKDLIILLN